MIDYVPCVVHYIPMTYIIYNFFLTLERKVNTCRCHQEINIHYSLDIFQAEVLNPGIVIVVNQQSVQNIEIDSDEVWIVISMWAWRMK